MRGCHDHRESSIALRLAVKPKQRGHDVFQQQSAPGKFDDACGNGKRGRQEMGRLSGHSEVPEHQQDGDQCDRPRPAFIGGSASIDGRTVN